MTGSLENSINALANKIKNKITTHENKTSSTTVKGHAQAGGAPQEIGTSLNAGTDNGYYARADHVHTVDYDNILNAPDIEGIDLDNYIEKSNTSGLVKNDGTIDTTEYVEEEDFGIQIDEDGILTVVPLSDANVYTGDLYATKTYVDSSVPSASNTVPSMDTLNGDVGNGVTWARANHKHPKSDLYAEATHNHNASDLDEIDTIEATITYTDDSTEIVDIYIKPVPPLNIKITIPGYLQVSSVKVYDTSQNPQTEVASLPSNKTTLASGQTLNIPLGTYDIQLQTMAGILHLKEAFVYDKNHTEFEFKHTDFEILS